MSIRYIQRKFFWGRGSLALGAFSVLACSAGCSDIDFVDAVAESSPEVWKKNAERFKAPLNWSVCPEGYAGECAVLKVPVDWLDLSSESLELTIARRPAKNPKTSKGSFWILDGGPGSNGMGFAQGLDQAWPKLLEDYTVYTLVHRGAFHSDLLTCPKAMEKDSPGGVGLVPEELDACLSTLRDAWGDELENFRTSHAARDLSHAIRRTRASKEKVFVYGFSYGTLLAQRFAQIAPHQVDGFVLDGVLPPNDISYFDFDKQYDSVGERIAGLCAKDSFCQSKWGDTPWQELLSLRTKIDNGHCAELEISPDQLSQLTARLLAGEASREDAFALLYRVNRCDAADVEVVKHYAKTLKDLQEKGAESWDPRGFSEPLFYNIILAEVTGGGKMDIPSVEDVESACEDAVFCPGYSTGARKMFDDWPLYQPDRFYGKDVKFQVPVLAMSGLLDPQTPIETARHVARNFRGAHQQLVEMPYGCHGLWMNSKVEAKGEMNCAGQMVSQFLADPKQAVDAECLLDTQGLNFQGESQHNEQFFGTKDAWENDEKLDLVRASTESVDWNGVIRALDFRRGRGL